MTGATSYASQAARPAACGAWRVGFLRGVGFFLAVFCFCQLGVAEVPDLKTMSAHVVKVAPDNASLDVDFKHPATGQVQRLTFYVDNQTGLSKFKSLDELRSGQVVSIDYVEGAKHRLLIRRIARVKLSGPPAGLEKFRGL